ncbi:MAG: DegV family protein [Anaerolineaceae bacterium]
MNIKDSVKNVRLITDSVAQIPSTIAQQLNIAIVPYSVTIKDETYLDGVNLQPDELYRRMRMEKVIPKTAAPSPGMYEQTMLDCIRDGAGSILCIVLSSNLSGSYNSVKQAAALIHSDHPDVPIEVFDSKQAAISEGFIAIEAAKAAMNGADLIEVSSVAHKVQRRVGIVVSFDTLEYLALGGRIGKAAYLLGNLIDIKPIITLDVDGMVDPIGKVRGNQKAFEAIIDYVEKMIAGCSHLKLALMDADATERAEALKEMAIQRLKPNELITTSITPVMGAHTGPGLVGLGYYFK